MERNTRQRAALLGALGDSRRALTPTELCALAQLRVSSLSLSTVYRRLKDLVDAGEVVRVELPGHPTRFEAAAPHASAAADGPHHHHHFHCKGCDRVYPIRGCPGPMKHLAPRGFRVESHDLTLHGRCPACAPARTGRHVDAAR